MFTSEQEGVDEMVHDPDEWQRREHDQQQLIEKAMHDADEVIMEASCGTSKDTDFLTGLTAMRLLEMAVVIRQSGYGSDMSTVDRFREASFREANIKKRANSGRKAAEAAMQVILSHVHLGDKAEKALLFARLAARFAQKVELAAQALMSLQELGIGEEVMD